MAGVCRMMRIHRFFEKRDFLAIQFSHLPGLYACCKSRNNVFGTFPRCPIEQKSALPLQNILRPRGATSNFWKSQWDLLWTCRKLGTEISIFLQRKRCKWDFSFLKLFYALRVAPIAKYRKIKWFSTIAVLRTPSELGDRVSQRWPDVSKLKFPNGFPLYWQHEFCIFDMARFDTTYLRAQMEFEGVLWC